MDENTFRQKALSMGADPAKIDAYIKNKSGAASTQAPSTQIDPIQDIRGQNVSLIKKYFPRSEWSNAYKVMQGESGGNPQAIGDNFPINGQTIPSYGLFQIRGLPGRPDSKTLLTPEENVRYAAQMQAQQGWGPWTAAHKLGIVH